MQNFLSFDIEKESQNIFNLFRNFILKNIEEHKNEQRDKYECKESIIQEYMIWVIF